MIETLGSRLRQLRESNRLQQDQVAMLIRVTKSTVSLYENDLRQPPYETLIRLSDIYNVTTDYLLGCASTKTIDVSGLTKEEVSIINQLVITMSARNRQIEELSYDR